VTCCHFCHHADHWRQWGGDKYWWGPVLNHASAEDIAASRMLHYPKSDATRTETEILPQIAIFLWGLGVQQRGTARYVVKHSQHNFMYRSSVRLLQNMCCRGHNQRFYSNMHTLCAFLVNHPLKLSRLAACLMSIFTRHDRCMIGDKTIKNGLMNRCWWCSRPGECVCVEHH
jgi:hypothetical protein